jgi:hypothetical protein
MRNDPRVRKGDKLLIGCGLVLAFGVVLHLAGIM